MNTNLKLQESLFFWVFGFLLTAFLVLIYEPNKAIQISLFVVYFFPLILAFFIYLISKLIYNKKLIKFYSYILFFSISISSYFGITKVMDGSYASSPSLILFGLSFYSATLGFILLRKKFLTLEDVLLSSNPLLIFTGPILVSIKSIKYKNFKIRLRYFFPYLLFGIFLVEGISGYLTSSFYLSKNIDVISSLGFAIIFELFIYSNFCGLSLIIYGLAGIYGYLIPLNFKQPFSSNNIIEFWRGWHVSLSNVLKEFFYIPVRKKTNLYFAILIVFLSSALWHGGSLTFIMWGLLHFFCFALTVFLSKRGIKYLNILILFIAIIFGRLIFLESDINILIDKLNFKYEGLTFFHEIASLSLQTIFSILFIMTMALSEFFFRKHSYFRNRNYKFYRLDYIQIILMILTIIFVSDNVDNLYPVYGQR